MKDYKKEEEVFYSYNVLDQLMGENIRRGNLTYETRFKYDGRGNLTEKYKDSELIGRYEYGAENRLNLSWNKEQEAEYVYNGFGQRIRKTIYDNNREELSSERYVLDVTKPYNNLLMIEEATKQGIKNKTFTYDNKVVMQSISGINHVYMLDEMGSPLRVSDYEKEKEYLTYGYDEYGRTLDWSRETEEGMLMMQTDDCHKKSCLKE